MKWIKCSDRMPDVPLAGRYLDRHLRKDIRRRAYFIKKLIELIHLRLEPHSDMLVLREVSMLFGISLRMTKG